MFDPAMMLNRPTTSEKRPRSTGIKHRRLNRGWCESLVGDVGQGEDVVVGLEEVLKKRRRKRDDDDGTS